MQSTGRFAVTREWDTVFATEAYVLHDYEVGSRARVLPALGNNLVSLTASVGGQGLEMLLSPSGEEHSPRPTRYGNPILFPFPNRVRDATFTFLGHRYQLERNTPEGHHIHGFVRTRPWRVDEAHADSAGARLRSSFVSVKHPDVLRQYPFPFVLTVTYTLIGNTLRLDAQARNVGATPLPMGFGLHPYFRLPLRCDGRPCDCRIQVPARRLWLLDKDKLPTGDSEPVPPQLDFRSPRPVGDSELDHLYGELAREADATTCRLFDPAARTELTVRFGSEFPFLVVYAPAERPTICFEPYTCITDAVNLAAVVRHSGLQVLGPGQSWRGSVEFAVAAGPG